MSLSEEGLRALPAEPPAGHLPEPEARGDRRGRPSEPGAQRPPERRRGRRRRLHPGLHGRRQARARAHDEVRGDDAVGAVAAHLRHRDGGRLLRLGGPHGGGAGAPAVVHGRDLHAVRRGARNRAADVEPADQVCPPRRRGAQPGHRLGAGAAEDGPHAHVHGAGKEPGAGDAVRDGERYHRVHQERGPRHPGPPGGAAAG
mmetsp:Transcript_36902/g.95240  ORF Transcript_36902/g.95240 Transcript_36902/m.95240 type:complete len:201 (+) Transcript_36902:2052-2654(+)